MLPLIKKKYAQLTSWSFSVHQQYLKCPYSVCLDKIQRVRMVEPPNPAFEKGNRVHKSAELFVGGSGRVPAVPAELSSVKVKGHLLRLRKAKARVEQEWAFNAKWEMVGWFDRDCWLRIKTDVCADTLNPPTVDIVDWKTGKVHEEHRQQRSLYALGGLQLVQIGQLAGGSKDVQLTAQHVYVDTDQEATETFTMKQLAPLKREWLARIKEMMSDTTYRTCVGFHCRWCKFAASKGGPCPEK